MSETPPKSMPVAGVVLVFIDEAGHAIADASDFGLSAPGGYELIDGQRWRARNALAVAVCNAYASPNLVRGMEAGDCERVVDNLIRKHGCRVHEVAIGHQSERP